MRSRTDERLIFSDASAHAILSDLSPLITDADSHRVILAGDLNLLFGYSEGENRDRAYWKGRYDSVFDRAAAMGLTLLELIAPRRSPTNSSSPNTSPPPNVPALPGHVYGGAWERRSC